MSSALSSDKMLVYSEFQFELTYFNIYIRIDDWHIEIVSHPCDATERTEPTIFYSRKLWNWLLTIYYNIFIFLLFFFFASWVGSPATCSFSHSSAFPFSARIRSRLHGNWAVHLSPLDLTLVKGNMKAGSHMRCGQGGKRVTGDGAKACNVKHSYVAYQREIFGLALAPFPLLSPPPLHLPISISPSLNLSHRWCSVHVKICMWNEE